MWDARYFWIHLAFADLRSRWRRSFFGMLWSVIQPLGMTLLLSFVFGRIFKSSVGEYAPYILSGMVVWEFVMSTATAGSMAFVQADAYIKQTRHPLAIYTLRTTLANLVVLLLASVGLVLWVLVTDPGRLGWCWLSALLVYPLVALAAWPLATALAYLGARFRDLPHSLGLVFQALWFVSPIYIQAKVYRGSHLGWLVDENPIYHLLEILRAPLLRGTWPHLIDFAYCLVTILVLALLAWWVGRRMEEKVIFYL
ncbi:MAG: ABC transporter permease [bacterium]